MTFTLSVDTKQCLTVCATVTFRNLYCSNVHTTEIDGLILCAMDSKFTNVECWLFSIHRISLNLVFMDLWPKHSRKYIVLLFNSNMLCKFRIINDLFKISSCSEKQLSHFFIPLFLGQNLIFWP